MTVLFIFKGAKNSHVVNLSWVYETLLWNQSGNANGKFDTVWLFYVLKNRYQQYWDKITEEESIQFNYKRKEFFFSKAVGGYWIFSRCFQLSGIQQNSVRSTLQRSAFLSGLFFLINVALLYWIKNNHDDVYVKKSRTSTNTLMLLHLYFKIGPISLDEFVLVYVVSCLDLI